MLRPTLMAAALAVALPALSANAGADADLDALRAELKEMKSDYESRIQALEKRLEAAESQAGTAQTPGPGGPVASTGRTGAGRGGRRAAQRTDAQQCLQPRYFAHTARQVLVSGRCCQPQHHRLSALRRGRPGARLLGRRKRTGAVRQRRPLFPRPSQRRAGATIRSRSRRPGSRRWDWDTASPSRADASSPRSATRTSSIRTPGTSPPTIWCTKHCSARATWKTACS